MVASTLRVRARNGIVTRFDLIGDGIKRMIGRRLEAHPDAPNGFAWVDTGEVDEIPNRIEHRIALKDGSLWAADEATAREVWGADWREHFDPSFGTAPSTQSDTKSAVMAPEEKV